MGLCVMRLLGGRLLLEQPTVHLLQVLEFSLEGILLGRHSVQAAVEAILSVGGLPYGSHELVCLRLQTPVLVLVALLALIKRSYPLRKPLRLKFQSRLLQIQSLQCFFTLCQEGLQLTDLGEQRCGDFGRELDVMDAA